MQSERARSENELLVVLQEGRPVKAWGKSSNKKRPPHDNREGAKNLSNTIYGIINDTIILR